MKNIEEIIDYKFKDKSLLEMALTHSSYGNKNNCQHNERLEFLGDSILDFIVADYLYKKLEFDEGKLTKIRADIVNYEYLGEVISNYNLDKYLKVFPSNMNTSFSIKSDLFEAILGAIYLDGGLGEAYKFVVKFLKLTPSRIKKLSLNSNDYKNKLQELVQAKKVKLEYKFIGEEGMPNDMTFQFALYVNDKFITSAKGKSKQKAENTCAKFALEKLSNLFD